MKILQISFKDPTRTKGGIESVIFNLSKNLLKNGNEIDILCTSEDNYIKNTEIGRIISIKTPNFDFLGLKGNLIKKLFYNIKIKNFIKLHNKEYDVVHVHGDVGGLKEFKNLKTVATFHGFTAANPAYKKYLKRIFLFIFSANTEFKNLKYCKKITVVSNNVKLQMKNYTDKDIDVIYNGIDLDFFKKISKQEKIRLKYKLNLKENKKYILFVGTQSWIKGLDIAINTIRLLKREDIVLNVIGLKRPKNFKEPNINFLGLLEKEKIINYYQVSDLFIMPSRYEGFSIVVLEAMACGLPVILANNIGSSEIIKNNINGISINNTSKNFSSQIKKILADVKLKNKIIENSFNTIKKFDWKYITVIYINLYNNI